MVANLEKEESKLENELKVASEKGAKESVITDLLNKIRKNNAELKKAKTELKLSDKLIYGDLLRFDPNNRYKTGTMTTKFE